MRKEETKFVRIRQNFTKASDFWVLAGTPMKFINHEQTRL